MTHHILAWDSAFFEFKVARVDYLDLTTHSMKYLLSKLRRNGVSLVYWSVERPFETHVAERLGGRLVDSKTFFVIDLSAIQISERRSSHNISPFTHSMSLAALEALAVQSGEYSRFAVDPRIPREKFTELYKVWLRRSVDKEIATDVLVIHDKQDIAGMVTLGEKNGRGDIGLLAVDHQYRGKGYGEQLVLAAQQWFVSQGYRYGQVITQGRNTAACNLYAKCGYQIERVEYFYHFWLV